MTNSQKFPMNADDTRIAARQDDYAAYCARVDAELRRLEIAQLDADLSAS